MVQLLPSRVHPQLRDFIRALGNGRGYDGPDDEVVSDSSTLHNIHDLALALADRAFLRFTSQPWANRAKKTYFLQYIVIPPP